MENTNSGNKPIFIIIGIVVLVFGGYLAYSKIGTDSSSPDEPVDSGIDANFTQEARKARVLNAIDNAVVVTSIDITSCAPNPLVAQFGMNAPIDFLNRDSVAHTISFSPQYTFDVPAKGKYRMVFDFFKFPGVRKYSCDSKKEAGSVLITK